MLNKFLLSQFLFPSYNLKPASHPKKTKYSFRSEKDVECWMLVKVEEKGLCLLPYLTACP